MHGFEWQVEVQEREEGVEVREREEGVRKREKQSLYPLLF